MSCRPQESFTRLPHNHTDTMSARNTELALQQDHLDPAHVHLFAADNGFGPPQYFTYDGARILCADTRKRVERYLLDMGHRLLSSDLPELSDEERREMQKLGITISRLASQEAALSDDRVRIHHAIDIRTGSYWQCFKEVTPSEVGDLGPAIRHPWIGWRQTF